MSHVLRPFDEECTKAGQQSHCEACGKEIESGTTLCSRCTMLNSILGEWPSADRLASAFWDHCFACEAEIIASIQLTPESLTVQCDECGEIHVIPFEEDDLRRYIRSGIVREMVADD